MRDLRNPCPSTSLHAGTRDPERMRELWSVTLRGFPSSIGRKRSVYFALTALWHLVVFHLGNPTPIISKPWLIALKYPSFWDDLWLGIDSSRGWYRERKKPEICGGRLVKQDGGSVALFQLANLLLTEFGTRRPVYRRGVRRDHPPPGAPRRSVWFNIFCEWHPFDACVRCVVNPSTSKENIVLAFFGGGLPYTLRRWKTDYAALTHRTRTLNHYFFSSLTTSHFYTDVQQTNPQNIISILT